MNIEAIRQKLADATKIDVSNIYLVPPDPDVVFMVIPSWCDEDWKILIYGLHELMYSKHPIHESEFSIDFKSDYIGPLSHQLTRKIKWDMEAMKLMPEVELDKNLYLKWLECHFPQLEKEITNPVELKAINECISLRILFIKEQIAGNSPKPGDYVKKLCDTLQNPVEISD